MLPTPVVQPARERSRGHAGAGFLRDSVARREHAGSGVAPRSARRLHERVGADQVEGLAERRQAPGVRSQRGEVRLARQRQQQEAIARVDHHRAVPRREMLPGEAQRVQCLGTQRIVRVEALVARRELAHEGCAGLDDDFAQAVDGLLAVASGRPGARSPRWRRRSNTATVACPQWAICRVGVKNSSRRVATLERETKAVSDSPTARAMACRRPGEMASASNTTPAGLPPAPSSMKAWTTRTSTAMDMFPARETA